MAGRTNDVGRKPMIAPEQTRGGAGAKPNAAATFPHQTRTGHRGMEANTARSKGRAAPDHRVAGTRRQAKPGSQGVYTRESR